MLMTDRQLLTDEVVRLAELYGGDRSALLGILREFRKEQRALDAFTLQVIADVIDVHPVEVYGVVSFYAFLNEQPGGQFVIRLCRTISCDMKQKERIANQLTNDLGIDFGETTADGRFSLEWTNCIGMCDQGPALMVNDAIHTRVTPEKAYGILKECRRRFGVHAVERREQHLA